MIYNTNLTTKFIEKVKELTVEKLEADGTGRIHTYIIYVFLYTIYEFLKLRLMAAAHSAQTNNLPKFPVPHEFIFFGCSKLKLSKFLQRPRHHLVYENSSDPSFGPLHISIRIRDIDSANSRKVDNKRSWDMVLETNRCLHPVRAIGCHPSVLKYPLGYVFRHIGVERAGGPWQATLSKSKAGKSQPSVIKKTKINKILLQTQLKKHYDYHII